MDENLSPKSSVKQKRLTLKRSEPMNKFVAPVEATSQIATGIALANLGNAQVLQLALLDEEGNTIAVAEEQLGAKRHFAKLIPEL